MEEVSGVQGILSNMFGQYNAGGMSFEQYASGVSEIQQQNPEIFNEAVNTPIAPSGGFQMESPAMGNPAPAPDMGGAQPGGWENFSGLLK